MLLRDLLTNLPNPMLDGVTTLSCKTSHAPAFRPGNASGVSAPMNFGLFSMNMGACSHPEDAARIARVAEDIGPMGRSTDLLLMHSAGLAALRSHAVWFCRVLGDRRRTSRGRCVATVRRVAASSYSPMLVEVERSSKLGVSPLDIGCLQW